MRPIARPSRDELEAIRKALAGLVERTGEGSPPKLAEGFRRGRQWAFQFAAALQTNLSVLHIDLGRVGPSVVGWPWETAAALGRLREIVTGLWGKLHNEEDDILPIIAPDEDEAAGLAWCLHWLDWTLASRPDERAASTPILASKAAFFVAYGIASRGKKFTRGNATRKLPKMVEQGILTMKAGPGRTWGFVLADPDMQEKVRAEMARIGAD